MSFTTFSLTKTAVPNFSEKDGTALQDLKTSCNCNTAKLFSNSNFGYIRNSFTTVSCVLAVPVTYTITLVFCCK